jgi:hypothetical protein
MPKKEEIDINDMLLSLLSAERQEVMLNTGSAGLDDVLR